MNGEGFFDVREKVWGGLIIRFGWLRSGVGRSPKQGWTEYAAGASSSKASNMREYIAAKVNQEDISLTRLRGKSAIATQASQPTTPMNASRLAKSAKIDSNVPCIYRTDTRDFINMTDMNRNKDEDHEWWFVYP